ncbi:uncharacterized protein EV154DRAFT_503875 [Mucor mucedo]|uniref:uncharacterized protein n=1 Tax=Mucor mucedo TaxID=29922 RepID=UPI00221E8F63|nr:uncharacterized protein EV154DRAFT_503875 [Mucor mucedo]KAI7892709.1 hypothetical protein EV154DRAFT_503875 [Mucor mucedo]
MTDCTSLIIHNLDKNITEEILSNVFALISPIASVKITSDNRNNGLNCAVIEFHEYQAAEQALHAMDKRVIYNQEIAVNWNNEHKDDDIIQEAPSQVIVSDLDPKVDDEILRNTFKQFHIADARVINGQGIVTFDQKSHAEEAIRQMDSQPILSSNVHCYMAPDNSDAVSTNSSRRSSSDSDHVVLSNMSYEEIFAQTPLYNTSVYISNLPKQVIKQDIIPHLQQYGFVSDIYVKGSKATVKLDTHANAATAIFALQGVNIAGNNVRLGWVKDRAPQRVDSQDNMQRSYNVFSPGYITPSKYVNLITNTYDNHTTMRPPAPTSDPMGGEPGGGLHGWNQYYQQYYSAGHLTI